MNHAVIASTACLAALLTGYGCKSEEPKPHPGPSGGSGQSGETGAAGEAGLGGTTSGGNGGSSAGGSSGTGGGSSGTGGTANQGLLLGPVTDDQQPITVGAEHGGFFLDRETLLTDADGNFFTADIETASAGVYKYPASLSNQPLWHKARPEIDSVALSITPDGEVITGGQAVAKFDPDGVQVWRNFLGGDIFAWGTTVTPEGAIIAAGTSPDGPWIGRFEADGTPGFFENYADFTIPLPQEPLQVLIDATNNINVVSVRSALRVDAEGVELSRAEVSVTIPESFAQFLPLVMGPGRDSFYTWAKFEPRDEGAFGKFSLERTLLYYRLRETARRSVVDPAEQITWSGVLGIYNGGAITTLAVGADAAYLVGGYINTYVDASGRTARPSTSPLWVGRYDLMGNRVWFQEFTFEGYLPEASSFTAEGIVLDSEGNPVIAVSTQDAAAGNRGGYLLKLSAQDGSVLPAEP